MAPVYGTHECSQKICIHIHREGLKGLGLYVYIGPKRMGCNYQEYHSLVRGGGGGGEGELEH